MAKATKATKTTKAAKVATSIAWADRQIGLTTANKLNRGSRYGPFVQSDTMWNAALFMMEELVSEDGVVTDAKVMRTMPNELRQLFLD